MWVHLPDGRREELVQQNPSIKKRWAFLKKQEQKQKKNAAKKTAGKKAEADLPVFFFEKHLLWTLIKDFTAILADVSLETASDRTRF